MEINHVYDKTILFFSPHHDDLVLSCGGLVRHLFKKNCKIYSINIFTRSNWSPFLGDRFSQSGISKIRSIENENYCNTYNIFNTNLDFKDSSLRGFTDKTELTSNVIKDSEYIKIEKNIKDIVNTLKPDYIFSPTAIGNHIDHLITFNIINEMKLINVFFYEDLPYANKFLPTEVKFIISKQLNSKLNLIIDITEEIPNKIIDIGFYKSQLEAGLIENTIQYSKRFHKGLHFERIWYR